MHGELYDSPSRSSSPLSRLNLLVWLVLIAMTVTAFFVILFQTDAALPLSERLLISSYQTLCLLQLECTSFIESTSSSVLLVLRFMTPVLLAVGIVTLAARIISGSARARLLGKRNHIIICGLGDFGLRLALSARASGRSVVVITGITEDSELGAAQDRGVIIMQAKAADAITLKRARVKYCSKLFTFHPVAENAEIISSAINQITSESRGRSSCRITPTLYSHVSVPELSRLLQDREYKIYQPESPWIEYINSHSAGARILWKRTETTTGSVRALLMIGCTEMNRRILERAMYSSCCSPAEKTSRAWIAVVGRNAFEWSSSATNGACGQQQTGIRWRAFDQSGVDWCSGSASLDQGILEDLRDQKIEVFVAEDDDESTLKSTVASCEMLRRNGLEARVHACFNDGFGYGRLLGDRSPGDRIEVEVFSLLDEFCDLDAICMTPTEALAQAIHEGFIKVPSISKTLTSRYRKGWGDLSEEDREASRAAARMCFQLLARIGYTPILPALTGDEVEYFEPADLEELARAEHSRWCEHKRAQGYVPPGEPLEKGSVDHHQSLIDYDELPEIEKEKDRLLWRSVLTWLAGEGYALFRAGRVVHLRRNT